MTEDPIRVAVALGSNVGDRLQSLQDAVRALRAYIDIEATSPVYETAAEYVLDQPAFLNAALVGKTKLEPTALLWTVKDLEFDIGRTPTFRFGPRIIDIDLLFYGDRVIQSSDLILPHPRMPERAFVLKPLNDIAPDYKHPITGLTVAQMLAALPPANFTNMGALL